MSECKDCQNWHRKHSADLKQQNGECRYNPPFCTIQMVQTPQGAMPIKLSGYPEVPANNPICKVGFRSNVGTVAPGTPDLAKMA